MAEPTCKWQAAAYFQTPALGKGLAISIPVLHISQDSCSTRHLCQPDQGSFPEVCNHPTEGSTASSAISQAPAHSQVFIGRKKQKASKTGVNSGLRIRGLHKWPVKVFLVKWVNFQQKGCNKPMVASGMIALDALEWCAAVTDLSGDDLGSRHVTDIRQGNEVTKRGHPISTWKILVLLIYQTTASDRKLFTPTAQSIAVRAKNLIPQQK